MLILLKEKKQNTKIDNVKDNNTNYLNMVKNINILNKRFPLIIII